MNKPLKLPWSPPKNRSLRRLKQNPRAQGKIPTGEPKTARAWLAWNSQQGANNGDTHTGTN